MSNDEEGLFGELARQDAPVRDPGLARYVEAERDAIVYERFEFDALIEADHPARAIWQYLEKADLSALYARIRARAHTPGRPPPDPRVVLALWLYACVEGVGSARQLERLSEEHNGFRWLRGGVPLNYHLLSDFRWQAAEVADRLLTQGVLALWAEELVTLASLTQDGVRIRAAAGASSYRRLARLKELLAEVGERVAALKREIDADPDASNRRMRAAQRRAAREQAERVSAAIGVVQALEAEQAAKAPERKSGPPADGGTPATGAAVPKKKEPRASTTDAEARVMRMPDGGYRPAYNGQIIGDLDSTMILGVGIDTTGSDGGLMAPATEDIERRYGHCPARWLADGGFAVLDDIAALAAKGITVFCPPKPRRNPKSDPAAPRPGDPPAVAQWRRRMVEDAAAGADSWMRRRGEAELIHANFRNRGLQRFNVRGAFKARTVLLFQALAHNILTALRLRAAAA
ncbi:MAG TPA: transposase [Alphaproteobacteria bacterium]